MRGDVPGTTSVDRAVRIAGALAELGITRVMLHRPGEAARGLEARRTDLPALIAAAPDGTELRSDAPAIRVAITSVSARCESDDPAAIQALCGGA